VGGHLIDPAAVVVFMVDICSCSGSIPVSRTDVGTGQQRGVVVERTRVREDWALLAVVGCAGWGGD